MNLRNVALLIFLVGFSFQSETYSFSSKDEIEQIKEQKKVEDNNETNNDYEFFISLIVISNYIKIFFNFYYLVLCIFTCIISSIRITLLENDELKLELKSISGDNTEKENISMIFEIMSNNNKYWVTTTLFSLVIISIIFIYICINLLINDNFKKIFICFTLFLISLDLIPRYIVKTYNLSLIPNFFNFLKFLIYITSPITFFLGKLYSCILSNQSISNFKMNKKDIKAFIELQRMKKLKDNEEIRNPSDIEISFHEPLDEKLSNNITNEVDKKLALNEEEANLMLSALNMREKKVEDVMIPLEKVFTIDYDEVINEEKLKEIIQKGYSRIPVFSCKNQNDLLGIVRIKQLLGLNFEKNKSLSDLNIKIRKPIVVHPNIPIIDLLKTFLNGRSHMAFITDNVEKMEYNYGLDRNNSIMDLNDIQNFRNRNINSNTSILGIVTLEDVIEHIYNIKINDEDDYDNEKKLRMKNQAKQKRRVSNHKDNFNSKIAYGNPFDEKKDFLIDDLPYKNSNNKLENIII